MWHYLVILAKAFTPNVAWSHQDIAFDFLKRITSESSERATVSGISKSTQTADSRHRQRSPATHSPRSSSHPPRILPDTNPPVPSPAMNDSESLANGRVPPLTQLCQRAAASYVESITTLGDNLSYSLVKPILERCSAEHLLKLEESSPHLQDDSLELWVQLCIRKYPTAAERYLDDDSLEPTSWRERYMILKHEEESRFERLGSKLKAQRLEAEERKKEREVKLTDRVPPPKRPRSGGWGAPAQPKTLLQKTLSEASKIQKAMYNSRSIPPMANGKSYRIVAKDTSPIIPGKKSVVPSRVCVNTVHKRPVCGPSGTSKIPTSLPRPPSNTNPSPMSQARPESAPPRMTLKATVPKSPCKTLGASSNAPPDGRPMRTVVSVKKDPMAALFVPKHRAYSQRPV